MDPYLGLDDLLHQMSAGVVRRQATAAAKDTIRDTDPDQESLLDRMRAFFRRVLGMSPKPYTMVWPGQSMH